MDIYAPELATHLTLSHARNIRMAEELLSWVEFVVADAVMKFNSQEPWQVVVSIDKRGCLEDSLVNEFVRYSTRIPNLPGPRGYPLLGSLPSLRGKIPAEEYRQWAKRYGNVFQLQLGTRQLLSSTALLRPGISSYRNVTRQMDVPVLCLHSKVQKGNAVTSIGTSEWDHSCKRRRKVAATALNKTSVESYCQYDAPYKPVHFSNDLLAASKGGTQSSTNVLDVCQKFALNLSLTLSYGTRVEDVKDLHNNILLSEILSAAELLGFSKGEKLMADIGEAAICLSCLLQKNLRGEIDLGVDKPCIQGNVLKDPDSKGLTEGELLIVANRQDIQQKAYQSIIEAGDNISSAPDVAHTRIDYIEALTKEIGRFFVVLRLALPKATHGHVNWSGASIPPKTPSVLNTWACSRDTDVFADADVFDPERWLEVRMFIGINLRLVWVVGCVWASHVASKALYTVFLHLVAHFRVLPAGDACNPTTWDPLEGLLSKGNHQAAPAFTHNYEHIFMISITVQLVLVVHLTRGHVISELTFNVLQVSAVLGDYLFVDGGDISEYIDGAKSSEKDHSAAVKNTTLIPLTSKWTPENVHNLYRYTEYPADIQPARDHLLWMNPDKNELYRWEGDHPAVIRYKTEQITAWSHPPGKDGAPASCDGLGLLFGGYTTVNTVKDNRNLIFEGVLIYNMTESTWGRGINRTMDLDSPKTGDGQAICIEGLLDSPMALVLGGSWKDEKYSPQWNNLTHVTLYDPISEMWYDQQTIGAEPVPRNGFCAVGAKSQTATYEIFIFAGNGPSSGVEKICILSLPGFYWFCPKEFGVDSDIRARHRCARSPDTFPNGIGIFDLTELKWKDEYDPDAKPYESPQIVQEWDRQQVSWASLQLEALFNKNSSTDTTQTMPAPTMTDSTNSDSDTNKSRNIGLIVGGVVGGVAFLALLVAGLWFLKRRRAPENLPIPSNDEQHESKPSYQLGGYPSLLRYKPELEVPAPLELEGSLSNTTATRTVV
ncbi:unnamed protein product [Clonostachys rosea f. rosea IK726]|uniref:Uncharacterized protein n=1 Tax=Clonostachys rosea f. rosea IK726 TaxID=1349383 RepID=A0ACA9UV13_BIOOC|nr:unnamed protein product [Clonostachys rosea f. rosea IK726]